MHIRSSQDSCSWAKSTRREQDIFFAREFKYAYKRLGPQHTWPAAHRCCSCIEQSKVLSIQRAFNGSRTGTRVLVATFDPLKNWEVENCNWYSTIGMLSFRRSPVSVGRSHTICMNADVVAPVDAFDFSGFTSGAIGKLTTLKGWEALLHLPAPTSVYARTLALT